MDSLDLHTCAEFDRWIDDAGTITLTAHTFPDGDALGSTVALCSYLRDCRGKNAAVILPNPYSDDIAFIAEDAPVLSYSQSREEADRHIGCSDLIICMDCNAFNRTEGLQDILSAAKVRKVLIDHHLGPDRDAFGLVFSTPDISSTCEHLFWILLRMHDMAGDAARLPEKARTALLAGMTTDTNNFANSVFPSTFEMASALLAAGTDREAVLSKLYNSYRENRIRLIGYLLGEKLRITEHGAAVMILNAEEYRRFQLREGESEGIVNMPLAIRRVRLCIFLKEYAQDGNFHISIRSKRGTSAASFAREYFHGGGHELAAGGRLYYPQDIAAPEDAEAYVLSCLDRFLQA